MEAHSVIELVGWVIVGLVIVAVISNATELQPALQAASSAGVSESLILSGNASKVKQ